MGEIIRVLRVYEFIGPRELVEEQIDHSVHGARRLPNGIVIRAATLGNFPEILGPVDQGSEVKPMFPTYPEGGNDAEAKPATEEDQRKERRDPLEGTMWKGAKWGD